ncbi:MAG TPA: response regulator [Candidatus Dormibacteraeota bacterium]|nr:response regulator [Candidatus Dormibacteraeota bacterium]
MIVVEDDANLRKVIRMVLERDGYEVEEAPHGEAALSAMVGAVPNAAVVDLKMPVMGGAELIQRMRSDARTASVPVVLLTGLGDNGEVTADVVLAKPFEPQRLLDCLRSLVTPVISRPPAEPA